MINFQKYIGVDRTDKGLHITLSPYTIIEVEEGVLNTGMDVLKQPFKGKFDFERNLITTGDNLIILFQWKGRPTLSVPLPRIHYWNGKLVELDPKVLAIYKTGRGRGVKEGQDLLVIVPGFPVLLSDWDMTVLINEDYELEYYVDLNIFLSFWDSLNRKQQ
jgi:hypothetical protein